MNSRILVIIVTYNGMKWLERCLASVKSSSVKADLFIVDNGSTDGSQEYICRYFPEATFIQSESNLGFGRANNIGLQHAADKGYEYVYLLNQDAWVEPDTFQTLIDMSLKHQEFGILSPIQIQANGRRMDSNFLKNVTTRITEGSLTEDLYFESLREIYEVTDVMAAHWLITRECLLSTGGFSPAFRHYGEDDNYVDRARFHGFKAGIVPAARAIHDREFRKDTLESLAYRCGTMTLIELSRITGRIKWAKILMKYFQYTYNYGLFRHYRYLFTHLFRLGSILRTRKQSRQHGAFLEPR